MAHTALVLPGGGSRTFYLSGVLIGLGLKPEQVMQVYALSTSAPIAAYFVTGQIEETGPAWIDQLISGGFLNWWRLLRFKKPADIYTFVHRGCASLAVDAIPRGKLFVNTLRLRDGATVCHCVTSTNARDVLTATCSFPIVSTPYELFGELHMDGGTEETFPVLTAHANGASKILAIANRPPSYIMKPYGALSRFLSFPRWPEARAALGRRAKRTEETRFFLLDPPPKTHILLIEPEEELPAQRLTIDKDLILRTFDLGIERGERYKHRLQEFLEC